MKAAVLYSPGDLRIEEQPILAPGPGSVVVAVEAAGICGTDVAVFQGTYPARLPIVLGHEFIGRVDRVGPGVVTVRPGQRVAAEGGWNCGVCDACADGRPGECVARVLLGRTVDGCFADHILMQATALHPLAESVPAGAAQAMTTLATALHAAERAGDVSRQRVAIVGPGHAGLLLLQVLCVRGAREVTVVGTRPHRLELARRLGAYETVLVNEFPKWVTDPLTPRFPIVFEASGTARGLRQALEMVAYGGTVVGYGIIAGNLDGVPGGSLYDRELTIVGSKGAGDRYDEAMGLLAKGAVKAEALVTHTLMLSEAGKGFALMLDRTNSAVRVVLKPDSQRAQAEGWG